MLTPEQQMHLRNLVQDGLPLVASPYAQLAAEIDAHESDVMHEIQHWQQDGLIKRFGLVVNHRKLGYVANAMVVWDIPDHEVDAIAAKLSNYSSVTLCYRRRRQLPAWPFNLFCMIHGKNRDAVLAYVDRVVEEQGLHHIDRRALFSTHQYKQRGGRYTMEKQYASNG